MNGNNSNQGGSPGNYTVTIVVDGTPYEVNKGTIKSWNRSAISACVSQMFSPSKRHSMRVRPSSVW